MLRYVPRALLGAAIAITTAACAAGGGEPASGPGGSGDGRYRILVPTFEGQLGDRVANDLRSMVAGMERHTAVPAREVTRALQQHGVEHLDAITARQLATLMDAQLVAWGEVQPGGAGLTASVTFTDVPSGDQITVENATGANPRQLAQAIFADFEQKVQGMLQAAFCADYLASEQFDRAMENCDAALAILPNSTMALYGRATALYHQEEYEEALVTYQRLLAVDEVHQDALLGAGLAASQLDRTDEALRFYRNYMELNPDDPQVRMKVAGDIAQAGDVVAAFRVLEPGIQANVDNLDYQQYLASVALMAGSRVGEQQNADAARPFFEAAAQAYERVLAARSDDLDAATYRQLVAVYNELGRTQDALRFAREGTQRFPDDAGTWAQLASVHNRAGQAGEEIRALTRVIEIDPDFENVYIRRALAQQRAGQRQQALRDFEDAARRGDRALVGRAIYGMAADELRRERWADAESLLQTAANYAGPDIRNDIAFFRGLALFRQGEQIARANSQGRPDAARRALQFFQQAIPHFQGTNHQQAGQLLAATRQYIENQEAIIQAARGR
jgi:tetratricopeptide (TPR) repeat protein